MAEISKAVLRTPNASRYLQQLCKHWSHKFEVRFDATDGHVPLPGADLDLAASDDALSATITLKEEGDMARLQKVVADHLNRFAFREGELDFEWRPV